MQQALTRGTSTPSFSLIELAMTLVPLNQLICHRSAITKGEQIMERSCF